VAANHTNRVEEPNRRRLLARFGIAAFGGTAGSTGNVSAQESFGSETTEAKADDGDVRVAHNPYDTVDWETVEQHKSEFHNHRRGRMVCCASKIIDLYQERGYTVYAAAEKSFEKMNWPWTELSSVYPDFENRDPEAMGVVAFPGTEWTTKGIEHVDSLFSTVNDRAVDTDRIEDRSDAIDRTLDREDHHVPGSNGGLAVIAHPNRHGSPGDWQRYEPEFRRRSREAGLLGIEAFNKEAPNNEDIGLWDNLLSAFAPERMIWGFSVDDPHEYRVGHDVDIRWTTLLLDETEFDPSDQVGSRKAAAAAMREGRTLIHQREEWNDEEESAPVVPTVESILVDEAAGEITIEASDATVIQWFSNGSVVETGETISLSPEHVPYVRAHLWSARGQTSTQPIGLEVVEKEPGRGTPVLVDDCSNLDRLHESADTDDLTVDTSNQTYFDSEDDTDPHRITRSGTTDDVRLIYALDEEITSVRVDGHVQQWAGGSIVLSESTDGGTTWSTLSPDEFPFGDESGGWIATRYTADLSPDADRVRIDLAGGNRSWSGQIGRVALLERTE